MLTIIGTSQTVASEDAGAGLEGNLDVRSTAASGRQPEIKQQ
jgi:hypothetical protein